MEKEKIIYLCVKSLFNISNDLKEYFEDYSNMILHIADSIARKMEKEMDNKKPSIHENGELHDLSNEKFTSDVYDKPQMEIKREKTICDDIDEEIEELVEKAVKCVREEISNTGC